MTTLTGGANPPGDRRSGPLTPEKLRTAEFGRAPFGRRGYHEEEVRGFLNRLAEDIGRSDAEKARLRAEIDRLRNYYREVGANVDGPPSRPAPTVQAIAVMSRAQQTADAQIAQAEEDARQLVAPARQRHEELLQDAQHKAAKAADEAAAAHQVRAGTSTEQDHLERRVAWLRTFAEVTQIQLKSTLHALSREIDKLGELPVPTLADGQSPTEPLPGYPGVQVPHQPPGDHPSHQPGGGQAHHLAGVDQSLHPTSGSGQPHHASGGSQSHHAAGGAQSHHTGSGGQAHHTAAGQPPHTAGGGQAHTAGGQAHTAGGQAHHTAGHHTVGGGQAHTAPGGGQPSGHARHALSPQPGGTPRTGQP